MATEVKSMPRFEIRPLSDVEGGGYLIKFPDFPGCVADGETPEQAIREGVDALNSYCKTLEELGRPVPETAEVYGSLWRQRAPKSLHAALARRAEREGVSLNMLARNLARRRFGTKPDVLSRLGRRFLP